MRGTDDDVASDLAAVELAEGRKGHSEFFIDAREAEGLGVEHDRETGGREGTEDFLTLAEAVAEERGRRAVGDGLLTKRDDLRDDCGLRRHDVTREAKRRFHDQGVRAWGGARLRREAGAKLEIARVE